MHYFTDNLVDTCPAWMNLEGIREWNITSSGIENRTTSTMHDLPIWMAKLEGYIEMMLSFTSRNAMQPKIATTK
jgi:hypothetical protein